jgi:hypothetical protein
MGELLPTGPLLPPIFPEGGGGGGAWAARKRLTSTNNEMMRKLLFMVCYLYVVWLLFIDWLKYGDCIYLISTPFFVTTELPCDKTATTGPV